MVSGVKVSMRSFNLLFIRAGRLQFGTDTAQSSPIPTELDMSEKYVCKNQKEQLF